MEKLKFIHLGTGGWGTYWLKNVIPKVSEFAECVAVVDIDPTVLPNAELIGIPENLRYTDLRKAHLTYNGRCLPRLHEV